MTKPDKAENKATKIASFGDAFATAADPITVLYVNGNHYVALKRVSRAR